MFRFGTQPNHESSTTSKSADLSVIRAEIVSSDRQLKHIEFSYEQVLDATKHQDDKIGRILTAVSFLTVASLALAALDSAGMITTRIRLGHSGPVTPLGFLLLGAFFIAVVVVAIQLIGSLSTPLRMPGIEPPRRSQSSKTREASTVYFNEIEKTSLDSWRRQWVDEDQDYVEFARRRRMQLIGETHNLAVRTAFKYNRTTEAVAILVWALTALASAIVVAMITVRAAANGRADGGIVEIDRLDAAFFGFTLALVVFLHGVTRLRYLAPGLDDRPGIRHKWLNRISVILMTLTTFSIVALGPLPTETTFSAYTWVYMVAVSALPLLTLGVVIWLILMPDVLPNSQPGNDVTQQTREIQALIRCRQSRNRSWRIGALATVTLVVVVLAEYAVMTSVFAWSLVSVAVFVTALYVSQALEPTFRLRSLRFRTSLSESEVDPA